VEGKMIFLQGSPELNKKGAIDAGRLSGIVYHEVPKYLLSNRLPSLETNIIEDWETKLVKIVDETLHQDMTLISGIAPWMIMYFEKLLAQTGKHNLKEIWPNLTLYVHGGVNFKPYEKTFSKLLGDGVDYIETYPASEGFIAFQDNYKEEGLLLNTDGGIFYEFIPADQIFDEKPKRIWLNEVELGINYAIILNTNAGLWGYNIGDTIKFVSLNPFKIVVTGRIKHFISAFGEHVIVEEVESAITALCAISGVEVIDFTVAPQIDVENELPYHEWFIEFNKIPDDLENWRLRLDEIMQQKNIYYKDLISGNILQSLKISIIKQNGFRDYMESIGKLGGQNKIPRLGNDRKMAEKLISFKI
jgi:acyl-CoA synthetase (AMP-forming)/AMP-acid ligase II